jgi:DNA-binding NtrC family response regulator
VLVVDDEAPLARSVATYLRARGYAADAVVTPAAAVERIRTSSFDVVLLDLRLGGISGLDVFRQLTDRGYGEPVVMMSAFGTFEDAVEALRLGAADFLRKPFDLSEVEVVVKRVVEVSRRKRELEHLRAQATQSAGDDTLVGRDPVYRKMIEDVRGIAARLQRLAPGDCPPVLITGETGIGKNVLAGHLHRLIATDEQAFVHVNCTAIQPTLFEAELFGHERGAFTDAHRSRQGLFEAANGGTLFLDEIGHLPAGLQAKLLTAIEEKAIRRVGSVDSRQVNVRVISSTNAELPAMVARGEFRADLFYRISTIELVLPPLRERPADVPLLASHFLAVFGAKYGATAERFDDDAIELLTRYSWPGNVREIRNLVERAVIRMRDSVVTAAHLLSLAPELRDGRAGAALGAAAAARTYDAAERALLEDAMSRSGGNISAAARLLGMTRERFRSRWRISHRSGDQEIG